MDKKSSRVEYALCLVPEHRAAERIRGELLTDTEQQHIEQHVRATLETARNRAAGGLQAKGGELNAAKEASVARFSLGQKEREQT